MTTVTNCYILKKKILIIIFLLQHICLMAVAIIYLAD